MSEPFLAQIQIVPYNFAPRGWATCDGQLLPINQNQALFSLLGTNYGGDGRTTFGLPNLQDSSPMHSGQGPGLTFHNLAEVGGSPAVTLGNSHMPSHAHQLLGTANPATTGMPLGTEVLGAADTPIYGGAANLTPMSNGALSTAGGSAPHNNRQPYLGLLFIIAMQGIFPARQ
jgi:microcystin-dependent protein